MRMWMINPKLMCNKHILGEHVELHMLVGCLNKKKNIEGYITGGLVEIHNIESRHNTIAQEMGFRGMNHNTPIVNEPRLKMIAGKIDIRKNEIDLMDRCLLCRIQAQNYLKHK